MSRDKESHVMLQLSVGRATAGAIEPLLSIDQGIVAFAAICALDEELQNWLDANWQRDRERGIPILLTDLTHDRHDVFVVPVDAVPSLETRLQGFRQARQELVEMLARTWPNPQDVETTRAAFTLSWNYHTFYLPPAASRAVR